MERDLAGARLPKADFERLAQACRNDVRFPASYAAWEALVAAGVRLGEAQGVAPHDVALDVDRFLRWCLQVGVMPCLDAVRAHLILARRGCLADDQDETLAFGEKSMPPFVRGRRGTRRVPRASRV